MLREGASVLYAMSEAGLQEHERKFIFLRDGCGRDAASYLKIAEQSTAFRWLHECSKKT